ncbi:MAG: mechanosensitive ion channel family protein [Gemmatimonadota bacterium]
MQPDSFDTQALTDQAVALVSEWGLQVLGALVVLVVGWTGAKWVRHSVRRALGRAGVDETLVPFLTSLTYYTVLAFVAVAVLNLFGIQTASMIAVLGAAGFAVGLAFQGTLSNFSSGVMLLIFRPFAVGDSVEVADQSGTVAEIGVFSTRLDTPDNVRVTVPNSEVFGNVIKNYDARPTRRVDLEVGIDYDDDIGGALDTARRVLSEDDRVLDEPEPTVAVGSLGDSSVILLVRPWCATADYWPLRRDLTRRLKEQLEADGFSLPYPQRDVHLHGGGDGLPGGDEA